MAKKGKQATTANSRPPPTPPRQEPLSSTPPTKSRRRKKPNNDFIRDVSEKVNSPANRAAAELEEEAEGAILPKQDPSTQTETVELDAHGTTTSPPVQDDKQDSIEDEFDLLSLEHKAAEELYKLPKFGESYEAVTVDVKRIEKRLKYLSMNFDPRQASPARMIFHGREIADSVSLLMIKRSSSKVIEMAGLKAQRAVSLAIQAEMMLDKARELLYQSQEMLQAADL